MSALGESRPEAHIHIRMTRAFGVLESNQKPAVMRLVVAVIDAAPSVHIDGAVWCHGELAGVADLVGKDGRAKPARQANSRIGLGTVLLFAECRDRSGEASRNGNKPQAHRQTAWPRYHSCETSLFTGAVGLAGVTWHRHSYDPKRKMRRTALRCLEQMRKLTFRDPQRLTI